MTTFDIQRFALEKMESGLGWACADHYRNLISRVFKVAKKWGLLLRGQSRKRGTLPEKRPVREKHILQAEQIPALLLVPKEPIRTIVLLAVLTGLRIGEILGLSWKSLDFTSGQLRVEQAFYRGTLGTPKTQRSRRTVPLPASLTLTLMRLKAQRSMANQEDDLVFLTRNGTPYCDTNLLHQHLKPAGRRLGIPWPSWHALRRTHATLFQVAGGSLRDAQAQLGRSKMSTTLEIYTLPMPAQQRAVVERLSNGDEW